jgi:peptidyl-prolyl cis-trans isomerase SurA
MRSITSAVFSRSATAAAALALALVCAGSGCSTATSFLKRPFKTGASAQPTASAPASSPAPASTAPASAAAAHAVPAAAPAAAPVAMAPAPSLAPSAVAALPATDQQPVDRVIASVDGEPITMHDVKSFAASAGRPIGTDDIAEDATAKEALKALIEQRLLDEELKKYDDKIDSSQVDRYLAEIRSDKHMSDAQFRQALMQSGVSYDEFRKQARLQLERAMMIQQEVREQIEIPESELKAYYDEHTSDFTVSKERYKLAQVLIAVPPNATSAQVAAAAKKAEEVRKAAIGGADFAELAHKYSDDDSKGQGGELGWFEPSDILDVILAGVKDLPPGGVSPVVRSSHGFHVLKLEDHEVPGAQSFAAVKDKIREKLVDEKARDRLQTWIETDLAKRHYVETMY